MWPSRSTTATGKPGGTPRRRSRARSPFSAAALLGQPRVRHRRSSGEQRGVIAGRLDDAERAAAPCAHGCSVVRSFLLAAAFEREVRQEHARLLAELRERQAEVGVDVQPLASTPRRTRARPGSRRSARGTLHERLGRALGAHRVAERHPRAALDAVHQERGPRRSRAAPCREEHEVRQRALRCGDHRAAASSSLVGQLHVGRAAAASAAARRRTSMATSTPTVARRNRGASARTSNLPPQLARVLDVPEREQAEPDRRGTTAH